MGYDFTLLQFENFSHILIDFIAYSLGAILRTDDAAERCVQFSIMECEAQMTNSCL